MRRYCFENLTKSRSFSNFTSIISLKATDFEWLSVYYVYKAKPKHYDNSCLIFSCSFVCCQNNSKTIKPRTRDLSSRSLESCKMWLEAATDHIGHALPPPPCRHFMIYSSSAVWRYSDPFVSVTNNLAIIKVPHVFKTVHFFHMQHVEYNTRTWHPAIVME